MNNPLISVIVPVYNLENYIEKTLNSIFQQSYSNIEVIAVDDGSKDNSSRILDKYAEKEIRLTVFHKENGGVSSARIKGIELSQGEYIGFVDGDDLIDSDMYERLLTNALINDADISHCGYRMIDGENTEFFYNTSKKVIQDNHRGLADLLEGKFVEPGLCNKLYKKELFKNILNKSLIMDFSFKENEDLLMNYCLFSNAKKSVYEDFCPYQYIIRNTSASHGKVNRYFLSDPIKIGEILLKNTENDNELYLLASRYYVVKLVKAATMSYKNCSELDDVKQMSRRKLKKFIGTYIMLKEEIFSKKALAVFAMLFPNLYRIIHKIYLK